MVQIVNLDPSEGNTRQRAFQEGMSMFTSGLGRLDKASARARAAEELKRRQMEQDALREEQRKEDIAFKHGYIAPEDKDPTLIQGPDGQEGYERFQRLKQFSEMGKEARKPDRIKAEREAEAHQKNMLLKDAQIAKAEAARAQGPAEKKYSGEQSKAGGFAKRAEQAQALLDKTDLGQFTGASDIVSGSSMFPEYFKGESRKKYEQAQNNFISAVLRKESGAAISDAEYDREEAKYFPAPGDTPDVLEQKRVSRAQAIENLKAEAGGAYSRIATAQPISRERKIRDTLPEGQYVAGQVTNAVTPDAQASGGVQMSQAMPDKPAALQMTPEERQAEKQQWLQALGGQ